MNTLRFSAYYEYKHERGYDMQHYNLLTADGAPDKRNRYDSRPGSSYVYRILAEYPIIHVSRMRKTNILYFTCSYTQQFNSSERMLYRLDQLGMNGCLIKLP